MGAARGKREKRRRGTRRAVVVLAVVSLAALAAGCGEGSTSESEQAADIEILNAALARELTVLDAYTQGRPLLRGPFVAVGREFRAQAQEHVDAVTKAIRGLAGEAEAEAEEVDFTGVESQADFLALAYGLENAALAGNLEEATRLATDSPRTLATALAASHAQHLVVLRRGLGASPAASAPEAFEPGDLPPPTAPTSSAAPAQSTSPTPAAR